MTRTTKKTQNRSSSKSVKREVYEILCVDAVGNSMIKEEKALGYSFLSNSLLFPKARMTSDSQLESKNIQLSLSILKVDPDDEVKDDLDNSFLVRVEAPFESIEGLREKLLAHLKKANFEHIYILTDEASAYIANNIYPQINAVENALRRYLIKFLVTKLGPNWWSLTADAEMKKKVVHRKNNESHFSKYADSKAYLIDFGELGKIVYAQSSGFISRDDIYSRVMDVEESPEAISALKVELQSNYNKFFKVSFKDRGFQQKWEKLEKIRHKVAHNSLFVLSDMMDAKDLTDELIDIVKVAEQKIEGVKFSSNERDAMQSQIVSVSSLRVITKDEILEKLKASLKWAEGNIDGFVGHRSFVMNYLGDAHYDWASSFSVIEQLEQDGLVELYDHQGVGHERSVKAIKLTSQGVKEGRGLVSMSQAFEKSGVVVS